MEAKIIIPTGYRKLATGAVVLTGDRCLQSASNNGVDVNLDWKLLDNVDFPWRVSHSVYVIRLLSKSKERRRNRPPTRKG